MIDVALPPASIAPATSGAAGRRGAPARSASSRLHILVCADERLVGRSLAQLLNTTCSIHARFVGRLTTNVAPAPAPARNVVLWFGDFAGVDQLATVSALRAARPHLPICVMVRRVDVCAFQRLAASDARGLGVLLRDDAKEPVDVVRALLQLLAGGTVLAPQVLEQLMATPHVGEDALQRLSANEQGVLAMLAYGYRNSEIARRLERSEKSVERHVTRIFTKLSLNGDEREPSHGPAAIDRRVVAARLYLQRPG